MLPENRRIISKKQLKNVLELELSLYAVKFNFLRNFICLTSQDILRKHQWLLRVTEYHTNNKHFIRALYYKLRLHRLQTKYGLYVPLNVCEKGLKIVHLAPLFINPNAEIGSNVRLYPFCGVVAKGFSNESPKLGEGVVLCMGSCVVGNITIANNVVIGANAVVTKSILEENITVGGVPAKKLSNAGSVSW